MLDAEEPPVVETVSNTDLLYGDVTGIVLAEFFHLYDDLGHGFLEAVYVKGLALYLADAGVHIEREVQFNVRLRGQVIGRYRADLVVESKVVVEVKAGIPQRCVTSATATSPTAWRVRAESLSIVSVGR